MSKIYNAVGFEAERIKEGHMPSRWSHKIIIYDGKGKKHEVGRVKLSYPLKKEHRKILKDVLEL